MKDNKQWKVLHFQVNAPLERCTDSMLFNSGTVISELTALYVPSNIGVCVKLKVVGDVSVTYRGQVYHGFSEFPAGLKRRIETHPNDWTHVAGEPDIEIKLNNWFEYSYCISAGRGDHIDVELCEDDLHLLTDDGLKEEMLEVAINAIEARLKEAEQIVVKIRDCEITHQNIQNTKQVLLDNGIDEDEVATVLQAIGYTLLDVELFPEVC